MNNKVLSVQDAVFPSHPFSGLLAIGRERDWRLQDMFPALGLNADGRPPEDVRMVAQTLAFCPVHASPCLHSVRWRAAC
ncbi:MAG: hypothetical protein HYR68_07285 [Burkholderiales bacterium]|nr:hypothetical protein [Burkholderiales bacterium]